MRALREGRGSARGGPGGAARPRPDRARPNTDHAREAGTNPSPDAAPGDADLLGHVVLDGDGVARREAPRVLHAALRDDRLPGRAREPDQRVRERGVQHLGGGEPRSASIAASSTAAPVNASAGDARPPRSRDIRRRRRTARRAGATVSTSRRGAVRAGQRVPILRKPDVSSAAPPGPDRQPPCHAARNGDDRSAAARRACADASGGGPRRAARPAAGRATALLGAGRRGPGGLGRGRPVHRVRPCALRGGGRVVAGVRVRAGGARRGRAEGTGPVAFTSFTFADSSPGSGLKVPRVVVGRAAGRAWITEFADDGPAAIRPVRRYAERALRWADGRLPVEGYRAAVAEAVRRMRAGALDKAALAHDLLAVAAAPLDPRFLLAAWPALRRAGRSRWTGWSGDPGAAAAAQRGDGVVAGAGGTAGRRRPRLGDRAELARRLLSSDKDRREAHGWPSSRWPHALRPLCASLDVPHEAGGCWRCATCRTWSATCTEAGPRRPRVAAAARRGGAPDGGGRRHAARGRGGVDRGAGGHGPRRTRARSAGWTRTATASWASPCGARSWAVRWRGCSRAAGWWPTRTRTPRSASGGELRRFGGRIGNRRHVVPRFPRESARSSARVGAPSSAPLRALRLTNADSALVKGADSRNTRAAATAAVTAAPIVGAEGGVAGAEGGAVGAGLPGPPPAGRPRDDLGEVVEVLDVVVRHARRCRQAARPTRCGVPKMRSKGPACSGPPCSSSPKIPPPPNRLARRSSGPQRLVRPIISPVVSWSNVRSPSRA